MGVTDFKREIAVVGGGLAGYATAIGFAMEGFDTVLIAPPPQADGRSTALIGPSVDLLEDLGIFERVRDKTQALCVMRIVDDTGRLLRAPTVTFRSSEIGLDAFGYNVLNADLAEALKVRAAELGDRLTVLDDAAADLDIEEDRVVLTLKGGTTVEACLVVGADGRRSVVREGAGIGLRDWSYPQTALVLNFSHAIDHGSASTEFHTRTGPFTQVPLPGRRSSLVWVESPDKAELLVDVKPERLARIVEEKMHSILGAVEIDGPVQSFRLTGANAIRMSAGRTALVGEAAHVFPPIGAQGLNLGLRDGAAIVAAAATSRDDPGRSQVLSRYEQSRRADVMSRSVGVDLLNRSLLADFLPAQLARTAGLSALSAFSPLRRFAMREGVAPGSGLKGAFGSAWKGVRRDDARRYEV